MIKISNPMKILLVSATKIEVAPILSNFVFRQELNDNFERYSFRTHTVDILITGVSMVAMAYKMGKYLNKSYDVAINLGICGAFNAALHIGEVVHVARDKFSELGVQDGERFLSLIDVDLLEESDYPITEGELTNNFLLPEEVKQLPQVKGITVNTVSGMEEAIRDIKKRFSPDVESMEGGAFMYACLKEKVPFFQIRAVSNYVTQRDKSLWDIPLAVKNVNETVFGIIEKLTMD